MIVNRRTFLVKKGKMDELVALLVKTQPVEGYRGRIYYPMFGPFDTVAVEFEGEDLDELRQSYEAASSEPGWGELMAKFDELTVPGGSNEIWVLAG